MVSFSSRTNISSTLSLEQGFHITPTHKPTMLDQRETAEYTKSSLALEQAAMQALLPSTTSSEAEIRPIGRSVSAAPATPIQRTGRWTPDEKILFLYGLKRFGKGRWKKMSIYLPHRSLVQIKSHAQKVLKRLEAGEDVFRRLEENCNMIDSLIVQAAKQRDSMILHPSPKSTVAKRKKPVLTPQVDQVSTQAYTSIYPKDTSEPPAAPLDSDVAALAASALCQLSSLS